MLQEERPPYVVFETRAVEDRDASIKKGCYVANDVDFALITPQGSKDMIERVVEEWFAQLVKDCANKRFNPVWLEGYRANYKAWKAGREMPTEGTPILNWPVVSPAQVKSLLDLGVRSVEDLAAGNEETIARLGMGGRVLKQRAVEWLESAKKIGTSSEEMNAIKVENKALLERNQALETSVKGLIKRLEVLEKKD